MSWKHAHLILLCGIKLSWASWSNGLPSQVTSPQSLTLTQTSGACRASTASTGGGRTSSWRSPRPPSRPRPSPRPSPGLRGSRGLRLDPWTPTLPGTHCRDRKGIIIVSHSRRMLIPFDIASISPPPAQSGAQQKYERERFRVEPGRIENYTIGKGTLAQQESYKVGKDLCSIIYDSLRGKILMLSIF